MAQRVVDNLEVVQVHEQHRELALSPPRANQGMLQAVHEQGTVGQPGQPVVECLILQPLLEGFALGDVVDGTNHPQGLTTLTPYHLCPPVYHPLTPIRAYYPVLKVIGLPTVERSLYLLPQESPLLRMDHLHEPLKGGSELPRSIAVDAEDLLRPPHLIGREVPLPVTQVSHSL